MENDRFVDFCATLGKLQGSLLHKDLKEDLINVAGFTDNEVKDLRADIAKYHHILLRKSIKAMYEKELRE